MSAKRVVVTGLGATSPVGGDVATTWSALLEGRSGVSLLTEEWAEPLAARIAATVSSADAGISTLTMSPWYTARMAVACGMRYSAASPKARRATFIWS